MYKHNNVRGDLPVILTMSRGVSSRFITCLGYQ